MNILYIHQHFTTPEEGGGTRSYEFARYLVKKGHAVTREFLSSFIEWGVDVIDKTRFDKRVILERARNFINFYTADIRDGSIISCRSNNT